MKYLYNDENYERIDSIKIRKTCELYMSRSDLKEVALEYHSFQYAGWTRRLPPYL